MTFYAFDLIGLSDGAAERTLAEELSGLGFLVEGYAESRDPDAIRGISSTSSTAGSRSTTSSMAS